MKRRIFLLLLVIFAVACHEEETLTPTETPEFGYSVPQGNHDYDDKIVDWKERFNTFTLYKFELKELYWEVIKWIEETPIENGGTYKSTGGFKAAVADEKYVGKQLELIQEQFLRFYSDTTLKRCLPLKILLCSQLDHYSVYGLFDKTYNMYSGYDCLAFNWGNEKVLTLTDAQKNAIRVETNDGFLRRLMYKAKITVDPAFFEVSNYNQLTSTNAYEQGCLFYNTSKDTDALFFITAIISTPYANLMAEDTTPNSYNGILNPKKDKNGLIRKKYDLLVNCLKENYNIDLQAIGNATLVN